MVRSTKHIGSQGEHLALQFMLNKGFRLLRSNYRYKRSEIDLILQKDHLLVFVEVKSRKNSDFGNPEGFVSENQIKRIQAAAEEYMYQKNWEGDLRFDIISISNNEIEHFEDAF